MKVLMTPSKTASITLCCWPPIGLQSLKKGVGDLMEHTEHALPPIPPSLIKALDEMFPDQCPRVDDTDRMVWIKAGQRQVVEVLIEHHKRQNETILGA